MKKIVLAISALAVLLGAILIITESKKADFTGGDYSIPTVDLSVMPDEVKGTELEYLYELSVVDNGKDYMAHPDSVLLKNGNRLKENGKGLKIYICSKKINLKDTDRIVEMFYR